MQHNVKASYMGVAEAAAATGLSRWTWRRWAYDGRVASVKLGTRLLIPLSEIERFVAEETRPRLPRAGRLDVFYGLLLASYAVLRFALYICAGLFLIWLVTQVPEHGWWQTTVRLPGFDVVADVPGADAKVCFGCDGLGRCDRFARGVRDHKRRLILPGTCRGCREQGGWRGR